MQSDGSTHGQGRVERGLASLPFTMREERVLDGLARWAGLFGRFQILVGGLVLLLMIGVAIAAAYSIGVAPEVTSETTPPLVSLGAVSRETLIAIGVVVGVVALLAVRSGVYLTDAAEDLEHHLHAADPEAIDLDEAFRALARFVWIETLLVAAVAFGLGHAEWTRYEAEQHDDVPTMPATSPIEAPASAPSEAPAAPSDVPAAPSDVPAAPATPTERAPAEAP